MTPSTDLSNLATVLQALGEPAQARPLAELASAIEREQSAL
jgi:hypothetical protein